MGGGRSLFGHCPNRPCNFFSGASLTDEYISGLKTAVGSPRTADSSFQTKFWTADSSFQIKSGPPTAVFRSNLDRRQQFSDQVLDRRQQFSDAWVLFGVQIVTLRPIFSKTRHVAHRVTYTTEKSSFRTIIWASMSKRVYFPFNWGEPTEAEHKAHKIAFTFFGAFTNV